MSIFDRRSGICAWPTYIPKDTNTDDPDSYTVRFDCNNPVSENDELLCSHHMHVPNKGFGSERYSRRHFKDR